MSKLMSNLGILITIISLMAVLFKRYKRYKKYEKEDEQFLFFKLTGLLLLGAVHVNIMFIPIPVGIFMYIIFFKPKKNAFLKTSMIILGVMLIFIWISIPSLQRLYSERDRYVKASTINVYTQNLEKELEKIKSELEIEEGAKIEGFTLEYDELGIMKKLYLTMYTENKRRVTKHQVYYEFDKKRYCISSMKRHYFNYQESLMEEEQLFYAMERIDFKGFTERINYRTYTFSTSGYYGGDYQQNSDMFAITEESVIEWHQEGLREKGYTFILSGEQLDEGDRINDWEYILPVER